MPVYILDKLKRTLTTQKIADMADIDGTATAAQLAANAVETAKIKDAAVTQAKLASGAGGPTYILLGDTGVSSSSEPGWLGSANWGSYTYAVSITGYKAILFITHDSGAKVSERSHLVPVDWINKLAGTDSDLQASVPSARGSYREVYPVPDPNDTSDPGLLYGRTADGRLRFCAYSGPQNWVRVYGVK